MKLTKETLNKLGWNDFSLMPYKGNLILILIYTDYKNAEEFLKLLHENEFSVKFLSEAKTNRHILDIEFLEYKLGIKTVFNKTEETYPVKSRLSMGINNITTGIKNNNEVQFNLNKLKKIDLKFNPN